MTIAQLSAPFKTLHFDERLNFERRKNMLAETPVPHTPVYSTNLTCHRWLEVEWPLRLVCPNSHSKACLSWPQKA